MSAAPQYSWTAPQYHTGQTVQFEFRKGCWLSGQINYVQTLYGPEGEAWHTYMVMADGHSRSRHITEQEMRPQPSEQEPS